MATSLETLRGGARIGLANATWPFAKLQIAPEQLVLQVKFLGTFTFTPDQVIKVALLASSLSSAKGFAYFTVSPATQTRLSFGTYAQTCGHSLLRSKHAAMAPNYSFKADGYAAA
ncbi:hypothetical protein [Rhodanobacter soli]|uniref:Uncharacterized protein n=1 Tax=Rhodanobacter soli TaxID=590609 RepID=A0ABV2PWN4_9GAMM